MTEANLKDSHKLLWNVNQVFTVVTFLFGRTVFQLYVLLFYCIPFGYQKYVVEAETMPIAYKILLGEFFFCVAVNIALNFLWSWILVKKLVRVLIFKQEDTGFAGDTDPKVKGNKESEMSQ